MFDIAICNDSIDELEHLDYLLEVYRLAHPWPVITIRRFQSLYDLVDCIRAGRTFPLYLLGHSSELWMNGLSPEAVLRREEPKGEIIAITPNPQAAFLLPVPGDPLGLAACLRRPVGDHELFQVLDRLIQSSLSQDASLQPSFSFPTAAGRQPVPFANISYMEYVNHMVACYLGDGGKLKTPTLRQPFYQLIRPLLMEQRFCQISTSLLVNLDFVDGIARKPREVQLTDGTRIPVPANAISGVLKEYTAYFSLPGKKRTAPVSREK